MPTELPVRLDRYFFTRLIVIANPDHRPSESGLLDVEVDSSINVSEPTNGEDEDVLIAEQHVKLLAKGNPALPYSIDVACVGFISVDKNLPQAERVRLATQIGHTVLYSSIRETILSATSRQPWGPLSIGLSVLKRTPATTEIPSPPKRKSSKASRKDKK